MRLLAILILILTPLSANAYTSGICAGAECLQKEVGVFMAGISQACGNSGTCQLTDILTVFVNVGNFILGIIGAVVLLMYVIGGLFMLTSAGDSGRVTKGKEYIKKSTIGLLIVMFAYLGVYSLRGVVQYGSVTIDEQGYVVCTGGETTGEACGPNMVCTADGACISECRDRYAASDEVLDFGTYKEVTTYQCLNKDLELTESEFDELGGDAPSFYSPETCIQNLCPGAGTRVKNVQCCQLFMFQ